LVRLDDVETLVRHPRLAGVAVATTAVLVALAPTAPANAEPAPLEDVLAGSASGAQRSAVQAVRRNPNPLIYDVYRGRRPGGSGAEPPGAPEALCRSFLPATNPYRNPAPNVDQIFGDLVTQAGTGEGCPTAQNETTIAVNPYNPKNLVAGANDYRLFNARIGRNDSSGWAYTSFDGGRTWRNTVIPKLNLQTGGVGALSYMDAAGDPVIAFGPNNIVYYSLLVFSRQVPTDGTQQASGQVVSVSRDGGLTWSDPKILRLDGVNPDGTPARSTLFNDKNWIAADPLSGTVYVTWTQFNFDPVTGYVESPIVMSKSTDFGNTWSPLIRVSPELATFSGGITPFAQGSNPVVGRDGSLYVAYETSVCADLTCAGFEDHDAVVVSTSRNGGRSFSHAEVDVNFDFPTNPLIGRGSLSGENFRINSFPLAAYDPVSDDVWITWADDRNGQYTEDGQSIKTNGDVFVVRGRHGRNWTRTLTVGSPQDEVFPAVTALATRVAVSYYTRKYDPNGIGLDYAYSVGWGTGIGGARVRRITTETQNPQVQFTGVAPDGSLLQGVFIGDYTAIAMGWDFQLHPCWVDFRGRPGVTTPNQDAYTQSISALF
jgi:hypothetical protein